MNRRGFRGFTGKREDEHYVSHRCRRSATVLRRFQSPKFFAVGRGRNGYRRADRCPQSSGYVRSGQFRKDTSVILLSLDGGPSHMDLYDMKPEAPAEYRGIWSPIPTNVPGFQITELFPLQAQIADKFFHCPITSSRHGRPFYWRSLDVDGTWGSQWRGHGREVSVHGLDGHRADGTAGPGMPSNVAVPYAMSIGLRPGYFGANYLGTQHDPFQTDGDPNSDNFSVQNISLTNSLAFSHTGRSPQFAGACRSRSSRSGSDGNHAGHGWLRSSGLQPGHQSRGTSGLRSKL